jgi:hypothetical protein
MENVQRLLKRVIRLALNKTKQQMQNVQIFSVINCYLLKCFCRVCDAYGTCKMVISLLILKTSLTNYSGALSRKVTFVQFSFNFHSFCGFLIIHTITWIIKYILFSFRLCKRRCPFSCFCFKWKRRMRQGGRSNDGDNKALSIRTQWCL